MTGLPGVQSVIVNGITLAYQETGSGHPLLLVNGLAAPMDTWNPPFLSALSHHFRVIVFDNRGTGYSSTGDDPISIPLFAEDTLALMDALNVSRAYILGLSMGASIAQELVLANPGRVDRLILVAGTCGGDEAVWMRPETKEMLTDRSGNPADLANRMFSLLFPKRWLATHDPWQYCPEVHETTSENAAARQAEAFFSWPGTYDRLPAIQCPTQVIAGTDDVVIPPENADILAHRIPGARLVRIPGAGHGLQYQCPREFADRVIEFLQDR